MSNLFKYPKKIVIYFFYYQIPLIIFNIKKVIRITRIFKSTDYSEILKFKNIHKGERCFIVATGPSLTADDLEKLHSEVTFSMNSIVLAFKDMEWRPTYYGIQDEYVYEKIKEEVDNSDLKYKFFGSSILKKYSKKQIPKDSILYPLNILNHHIPHKRYRSKFSSDAFAVVYDGYSIAYSLLQIAVYMGFKEIYLLGADCNYQQEKKYFVDHGHKDPSYAEVGYKMICAYKDAKKYADKNGIEIYNATRGGMLEVFPRVDLDEVLGRRENE